MKTWKNKYYTLESKSLIQKQRSLSEISKLKSDILTLSSENDTAKELVKLRGLVSRMELARSQAIADSMALTAILKLSPSTYNGDIE